MDATMKVKSILPYFGGKRTLAPPIVKELGPHSAYWEPFCGSLAVLLAKEPTPFETVNDLNGDLINLARVLKDEDAAVEMYGTLSRLLMHEELFHEAALRWREQGRLPAGELDAPRAADFMVCSWFGRNGVSGTSSYNQGFCVRYTKNGGHAAKRWKSAVESIPAWHERLRTVTILNRDAFTLLERIEDASKVVIYCDPPYLVKGAKYVHDFDGMFAELSDGTFVEVKNYDAWPENTVRRLDKHERLAELLARFQKTRVVVSYYDHPRLEDLYPCWTMVHLKATKALVNQGMRDKGGATKAPEVLLINGPSHTQPQGMF